MSDNQAARLLETALAHKLFDNLLFVIKPAPFKYHTPSISGVDCRAMQLYQSRGHSFLSSVSNVLFPSYGKNFQKVNKLGLVFQEDK